MKKLLKEIIVSDTETKANLMTELLQRTAELDEDQAREQLNKL